MIFPTHDPPPLDPNPTSLVAALSCTLASTPQPPTSRSPPPVAALSSTLSTAALDKHPQSKERGITLDLGFSAFTAPLPEHLAHLPYGALQFTLVDCPGHASLIRTIIGGEGGLLLGGREARGARRGGG